MVLTHEALPKTLDDVEPLQPNALGMRIAIGVFVVVPLLAVVLAIPVAWGGWLSWVDVALVFVMWTITALGITVG